MNDDSVTLGELQEAVTILIKSITPKGTILISDGNEEKLKRILKRWEDA